MPVSCFENFSQHPAVQRLCEVLTAQVRKPIWWAIPGETPVALDYSIACRTCHFVRRSGTNRQTCQHRFLQSLDQARKTSAPVQFLCPIQRYAVCLPVFQDGHAQGYIGLCHSEQAIAPQSISLSRILLETSGKEMEEARDLKNLSETIQPRCVALSTIHTIHRLISSTLNLEELLPRVARLCCQVLRVQSCVIWLLDRKSELLAPRAVIELKEGKAVSVRPCRLGNGIPGRVA